MGASPLVVGEDEKRPYIRDQAGKRLSGGVITMRTIPCGGDLIRYFPSRLGKSTTPDAMESIRG